MKISLILASVLVFSTSAFANKGYDISKNAEKLNKGFGGQDADMEMILINAHGDRVKRKMNGRTNERNQVGKGDQSLFTFKWPADVKGTKMLTAVNHTKSDDQWLFLPTLKRVKRINSSNKKGSFMGSEFSYEDLAAQDVEKFTYKYIKEDKIGDREVHVIERYSKEKKSGYSKQIVYLDKAYNQPLKIEYFDKKSELLKVATCSGFNKIKSWWFFDKMEMNNVQTKKKSILTWSNRKVGVKFSKSDFDSKKLAL